MQIASKVAVAGAPVIMTRADRGISVGVLCEVPGAHMMFASQSGSCEHGCGDQCRREKSRLAHSISPSNTKSLQDSLWRWRSDRPIKGILCHIVSITREVSAVVRSRIPARADEVEFASSVRSLFEYEPAMVAPKQPTRTPRVSRDCGRRSSLHRGLRRRGSVATGSFRIRWRRQFHRLRSSGWGPKE